MLHDLIDENYNISLLKQQLRQEKICAQNNKIETQKQKIAMQQLTKALSNNYIQSKSQISDYN